MAEFLGIPKVQYFDTETGEPLIAGKLYTYDGGSVSTPRATYTTLADAAAGTNANTNPVILDSRGEATVVISGSTKLVLKTADDVLVWSVDRVGATGSDIVDPSGNNYLTFTSVASAVNYVNITNAISGNPPIIQSAGGDTNIGLNVKAKGSGTLAVTAQATTVSGTLAVTGATALTGAATMSSTLAVTGTSVFTGAATFNGGMNVGTQAMDFLPAGILLYTAATSVPTGWLEANGQAVSRTTYAALFTVFSTNYGIGDGSTTFNLPNLSRRVVVGRGGVGTATLGNVIGNTGGEETHTMTTAELVAHTHTYSQATLSATMTSGGSNVLLSNSTVATSSTGSTTPFNVIQPSIVLIPLVRAY